MCSYEDTSLKLLLNNRWNSLEFVLMYRHFGKKIDEHGSISHGILPWKRMYLSHANLAAF